MYFNRMLLKCFYYLILFFLIPMRSLKKFRSTTNQRSLSGGIEDFTTIHSRPRKFVCLSFLDKIINEICVNVPDPSLKYVDYERRTDALPKDWGSFTIDGSPTPGINLRLLCDSINEYSQRFEIDYEQLRGLFLNYSFSAKPVRMNPRSDLFLDHLKNPDEFSDVCRIDMFQRKLILSCSVLTVDNEQAFTSFFRHPNISESLLAQIVTQVYCHGISTNVFLNLFHKSKIPLPPTLLANWFRQIAQYLEPLYGHLRFLIQSVDYVQVYHRTLPVKKKKIQAEYMGDFWIFFEPAYNFPFITFQKEYHVSGLYSLLSGNTRFLQTKNRNLGNVFDELPDRAFLGCWREIKDVLEKSKIHDEERCRKLLKLIDQIYQTESDLWDRGASDEQILRFRKYDSYLKIREIEDLIFRYKKEMPPKHPLIPVWEFINVRLDNLAKFTKRADFKIDTADMDMVFESLKILNDKDILFCGSVNDCFTTMILTTLVGCCISHNVDPVDWLHYALTNKHRHMDDIESLLPFKWKTVKRP